MLALRRSRIVEHAPRVFYLLPLASLLAPVSDGQAFGPPQELVANAPSAQSVHGADIDGDGDLDLIAASSQDDEVAWYENLDGLGEFGEQHVITSEADGAASVFPADLDGDGDIDVLSASKGDGTIAWYANLDGAGTFGPPVLLSAGLTATTWVHADDLDGDGDADVLAVAGEGPSRVVWFENRDGLGTFGPERVVSTATNQASSVASADVDGDGDADVLSTSYFDEKVAWYANLDGQGTFGPQQVISSSAKGAWAVHAADLDGDGDPDALVVRDKTPQSDGRLEWFENADGLGGFGSSNFLTSDLYLGRATSPIDADGDGDLDVLASLGYSGTVLWKANTDGAGSFGASTTIAAPVDTVSSFWAGDLDGDGAADVVRAAGSRILWNRNLDGLGAFGPDRFVVGHVSHPTFLSSADIDGDGDEDVLLASKVGSPAALAWVPNEGGPGVEGGLGTPRVVGAFEAGVDSAEARDLDGDGDLDLLAVRSVDSFLGDSEQVAWHANTDGAGTFAPEAVIHPPLVGRVTDTRAADLDGDGDLDVLVCTGSGGELLAYGNADGAGTFAALPPVPTGGGDVEGVTAADVDGDGDLDLVVASGSFVGDALWWHENQDGAGAYGPQQPVNSSSSGAANVLATDVDGDGDPDLLASIHAFPGRVELHRNLDGLGGFGAPEVLSSDVDAAGSLQAVDLDADGDLDVLVAPTQSGEVGLLENTDGAGTFAPLPSLAPPTSFDIVAHAADLDGDGFPEVLTGWAGYGGTAWFQSLLEPLEADVSSLSLSQLGSQSFELTAGVENGSRLYFLLGSASGTSPGTPLGGALWPLNLDGYSLYTLDGANGPILQSTLGLLGPNGTATAKWNLPIGVTPSLAGLELHHAYGVFEIQSGGIPVLTLVSNAVSLLLVP